MHSRRKLPASVAVFLALIFSAPAGAQVRPPSTPLLGGYQPIPNFTGADAGLLFRDAINDRFNGNRPISPRIVSATAPLGAEADGALIYCTNCQDTNPCTGGGTGAWAFGVGGQWECAASGALYSGESNARLNSLFGSKLDGSDAIANFNVNGVRNILDFPGMSNSTATAAVTAAAGVPTLSGGPGDFTVGENVILPHAGPAAVAITPTLSVAATCSAASSNPNVAAPTCASSYTYTVQGVDAGGGISAAAPTVTISNGASTLSAVNFNTLTISQDFPNNIAVRIYKCSGASCTPTLYQVIPLMHSYGSSVAWRDLGTPSQVADEDLGTAVPASQPQNLLADITAINGGSVTLSSAPSQSGAFTMRHDDEPPFAAAVAQVSASGGRVFCPAGVNINFAETLSLYQAYNVFIDGASRVTMGKPACQIVWVGPVGGTVLSLNQTWDSEIDGIAIDESAFGNTPGVSIDLENYNLGGGSNSWGKGNRFYRDAIGPSGIGIRVGDNNSSNLEQNIFDGVKVGLTAASNGWHGYFFGGAGETYEQRIIDGDVNDWDEGIWLHDPGSLDIEVLDFEHNVEDVYSDGDLGNATGHLRISSCDSEGANRFFDWMGGQASAGNPDYPEKTTIETCRFTGATGPDATFIYAPAGNLVMINNQVCEGAGPCLVSVADQAAAASVFPSIFIGNEFGDATPISAATHGQTGAAYVEIGDEDGWLGTANPAGTAAHAVTQFNGAMPLFANGMQHVTVSALTDPSAPGVTYTGAAGSTSYSYYLVCHDGNGGVTNVSAATTVNNEASTLSGSNYNTIKIANHSTDNGYSYCDVLRNETSGNVYIGQLIGTGYLTLKDTGQTAASYAPPARNTTGDAAVAGMLTEGCAGAATLSGGAATVSNPCITGARPVICTDNTSTAGATCSAVRSAGSVTLHGTGSDVVSWAQL
jgi:hypothetical protein